MHLTLTWTFFTRNQPRESHQTENIKFSTENFEVNVYVAYLNTKLEYFLKKSRVNFILSRRDHRNDLIRPKDLASPKAWGSWDEGQPESFPASCLPALSRWLWVTMDVPLSHLLCAPWMSNSDLLFLPSRDIQKLPCVSKVCLWVYWRRIKASFIITTIQSKYSFRNHFWRFYGQLVYYVLKLSRKTTAFNSNLRGAHLTFKFILHSMPFL